MRACSSSASRAERRVPASGLPAFTLPAFTLIEVLVVVGIIVLLISILLPALAGSKKQAQKVATAALLSGLRANIEMYATTFGNQYPGPISDADVVGGFGGQKASGTQNLLLGLTVSMQTSGGVQIPASGTAMYANPATTNGPIDYGQQIGTNQYKQYSQFYSPTPKEMQQVTLNPASANGLTYWRFPTVLDRFPDPLPVLYFRKTPGVDGTYNSTSNTQGTTALVGGANASFNRMANGEYLNATSLTYPDGRSLSAADSAGFGGKLAGGAGTGASDLNLAAMIANTANGGPPGAFVLMAAGPSRIYGDPTAGGKNDAIIVSGGSQ